MVTCPKCDSDIDVEEDELDEGDAITCDECGGTVKVLGLDPLELESEGEAAADDEDEEFVDDEEDEDADAEEEEDEEEDDDEDW
jgi:alpha-aminoadipate/glutamate carrier protein LysW